MTEEGVVYPIEADLRPFETAMAEMPAIAAKTGAEFSTSFNKSTANISAPFDDLKKKLAEDRAALKDLGDTGAKASASMIPAVIAIGAGISALSIGVRVFEDIGKAVANLAQDFVSLFYKASDWIAELGKFHDIDFRIPDDAIGNIEKVQSQLDAIETTFEAIGVQIANNFGTSSLNVLQDFEAALLAVSDVTKKITDNFDILSDAVLALKVYFTTLSPLTAFAQALTDLEINAAKSAASLTGLTDAFEEYKKEAADAVAQQWLINNGFNNENLFADALSKNLDKLADKHEKLGKSVKTAGEHWIDFHDDIDKLSDEMDKAEAKMREMDDRLQGIGKVGDDAIDSMNEKFSKQIDIIVLGAQKTHEFAEAQAEVNQVLKQQEHETAKLFETESKTWSSELISKQKQLAATQHEQLMSLYHDFENVTGAVQTLFDTQEHRLAQLGKKGKEEAKKLWEASKALSIVQTIAAGAVAVVQAFAQLGPIYGAIAAGSEIAATIASSIATIESQQPTFDIGTGWARRPARNDAFMAQLYEGEGVLTRQGVQNIGGPEAVNAANAGASGERHMVVHVNFRDRTLDTMIASVARAGGSVTQLLGNPTAGMAKVYG